jgi:hypothetical protein
MHLNVTFLASFLVNYEMIFVSARIVRPTKQEGGSVLHTWRGEHEV